MYMIDVRSDTVTKPSEEMRLAISSAIVGDDVYREDPTMNQLEEHVAKMFDKEAGLFFPSGTMSNLTALIVWAKGNEIIVGDQSHIFLYEQGGAAQYGGITYNTISQNDDDGTFDLKVFQKKIKDGSDKGGSDIKEMLYSKYPNDLQTIDVALKEATIMTAVAQLGG